MVDVKSISLAERIVVPGYKILWFYEIDVTIYDKISENFTLV